MTGVYILLGGIVLFATIAVLIDWLDERQERRETSPKQ